MRSEGSTAVIDIVSWVNIDASFSNVSGILLYLEG